MGLYSSDYGSGSSTSSSSSSWLSRETLAAAHQGRPNSQVIDPKSSSYLGSVTRRCSLDDVMREFQMNGSDSPYNPDEDGVWSRHTTTENHLNRELSGLGPGAAYLRQKSWPEPERSPAPRLARARPRSLLEPRWSHETGLSYATSTPVFDDVPPAPFLPDVAASEALTAEQARVLHSLPDSALFSLLRGIRSERRNKLLQECRFCKNNGERQSFYRSHALKDGAGRVSCPVLRAFTCRRCGARGDAAHTIKYCPLSTNEERIQSAGMMRSVRMASGRRRHSLAPSVAEPADYVVFGEPTPAVVRDTGALHGGATGADLDPLWAALEQKLSLY